MTIVTKQAGENKELKEAISMESFQQKKFEMLYKSLLVDYRESIDQREGLHLRLGNMSKMFNVLHTLAGEHIEDLDTVLQERINQSIFGDK